jgi:hypothetical protein
MNDPVHRAFCEQQLIDGRAFAQATSIIDLVPMPAPAGEPPTRYIAHFRDCHGLVRDAAGNIVEHHEFVAGICFPADYLCRIEIPQVLAYLGPHPAPWHPNIRPPFICANLAPGTPLVDVLYVLYELWTWNLFATKDDGLNRLASQWSRQQDRARFPIDRRPLKRRAAESAPVPV